MRAGLPCRALLLGKLTRAATRAPAPTTWRRILSFSHYTHAHDLQLHEADDILRLYAKSGKVLSEELDQEGDQQCINSDSFSESQTKDQVRTNKGLSFRVAANGIKCLTSGDTDADTRPY